MTTPIHIRSATDDDVPRIVAFQLAMALETEGLRLDQATVIRGVAAVLEDPGKGEYWLAEIAGETVGVVLTLPEWSDWRNGVVLWLHSVYVVPAARGQGVFRRLYDHIKELVDQSPALRGLRLYVDQRNAPAQAVYRAVGMSCDHYQMFEWLK